MMRQLLTTLGLLTFLLAHAQKPGDDVVIASIIDTLVKMHHFSFYYEKLQSIETKEYSVSPLDTFTIFDPETYKEVMKKGLDLQLYFDSINLYESKLFMQRDSFPDGLYLIDKIKSSDAHKGTALAAYIDLPSYPTLKKRKELSNSIVTKEKLGPYTIRRGTKENYSKYKYAMKAQFVFSGVTWDKTGMYCILECGVHYNIPESRSDRGPSGGGFQAILENKHGNLRILKFIGLWEE